MQLGRKPDAAPFLTQVENHAALLRHTAHSGVQLAAAVAAATGEDITRQALTVYSAEYGFFRVDGTMHQRQVGLAVHFGVVGVALELAEISRQFHHFFLDNEFFGVLAVLDNLRERAGFQPVFFLE